jgi:hypothetical protein
VPEQVIVLVPVASEFTVIFPPYDWANNGLNVTVTSLLAEGVIPVPPFQPSVNPSGKSMLETFNVAVPVLLIVSVRCGVLFNWTLPKSKLLLKLVMGATPGAVVALAQL